MYVCTYVRTYIHTYISTYYYVRRWVLTCGSNVTTSEHAMPADMRPGGVNLKKYIICMNVCNILYYEYYV